MTAVSTLRYKNRISKTCARCGKPFDVPSCLARQRFCSTHCAHEATQDRVVVTCATCGKPVKRAKNKLKNSRSGVYFCNRKCKADAQRVGGIKQILPPHYGTGNGVRSYRERGLDAFGEVCGRCGYDADPVMLDVHHKDGDRTHNELQNLIVLCVWCHALETRRVTWHPWKGQHGTVAQR